MSRHLPLERCELTEQSSSIPAPLIATAELVRPARLFNPDRVTAMDRAPTLDRRVDTDADLVVLRRRAHQDTRIRWEVPLSQRRHDSGHTDR